MTRPTMPTPDTHSTESAESAPPDARRRLRIRRTRRTVAVVAAVGLLSGIVGISALTSATSSSAGSTASSTVNSTEYWNSGGGFGHRWSGNGSIGGDDSGSAGQFGGDQSGAGTGTGNGTTPSSTATQASSAQSAGVAIIDTVLSSGEAAGTGIVLTSSGEILTNYHVVEQSTSIKVTIASTGKTYTATVVGDDPTKDVAVLQLEQASGLSVATIDTDTVSLSDTVTAVGNAGGTSTLSAATGTVTGLSKSITTEAEASAKSEQLTGLIETDAGIVAGDSGGPCWTRRAR